MNDGFLLRLTTTNRPSMRLRPAHPQGLHTALHLILDTETSGLLLPHEL